MAFIALVFVSTNSLSAQEIKSQIFDQWQGVMYVNELTSEELCVVGTIPESSIGSEGTLVISTHEKMLNNEGRPFRFDIDIAQSPDASVKIDKNKSHRVAGGLAKERGRLIQEFMKGKKAVIVWASSSKINTSTFSLNGFAQAYNTAKRLV